MNYDEDYDAPEQRCEHGTFIGSWWGPDYMCQYCEAGVSLAQQLRWDVAQSRRLTNASRTALLNIATTAMAELRNIPGGFDPVVSDLVRPLLKLLSDRCDRVRDRHRALVLEAWRRTHETQVETA